MVVLEIRDRSCTVMVMYSFCKTWPHFCDQIVMSASLKAGHGRKADLRSISVAERDGSGDQKRSPALFSGASGNASAHGGNTARCQRHHQTATPVSKILALAISAEAIRMAM